MRVRRVVGGSGVVMIAVWSITCSSIVAFAHVLVMCQQLGLMREAFNKVHDRVRDLNLALPAWQEGVRDKVRPQLGFAAPGGWP